MTESEFREEIHRQILEGKLIELRVRPRVHVNDQDGRRAYARYAQDMVDHETMEVRILALRLRPNLSKGERNLRLALAQDIVRRARGGEDFCALITQFSDDVSTRTTCGSRGAQPLGALVPQIQELVRQTKAGTYSDPVSILMGQEEVVLILMPMGESKVPPFEDVKSEMMQRALMEGLEAARKQWLQELRRNVYVDIRL